MNSDAYKHVDDTRTHSHTKTLPRLLKYSGSSASLAVNSWLARLSAISQSAAREQTEACMHSSHTLSLSLCSFPLTVRRAHHAHKPLRSCPWLPSSIWCRLWFFPELLDFRGLWKADSAYSGRGWVYTYRERERERESKKESDMCQMWACIPMWPTVTMRMQRMLGLGTAQASWVSHLVVVHLLEQFKHTTQSQSSSPLWLMSRTGRSLLTHREQTKGIGHLVIAPTDVAFLCAFVWAVDWFWSCPSLSLALLFPSWALEWHLKPP